MQGVNIQQKGPSEFFGKTSHLQDKKTGHQLSSVYADIYKPVFEILI
jgi:hypothetical protein